MNVPGSTHDSTIADIGLIYSKLSWVYETTGAICTVDSAFRCRDSPFLFKSAQTFGRVTPENEDDDEANYEWHGMKQAMSMCQTAEWGMRAIQASFPRISDTFLYETQGERRTICKTMILLYNLRARMVGINQIRNFYLVDLARPAEHFL
jgi:hypothetical protein